MIEKPKILIVDDNEYLLHLLILHLDSHLPEYDIVAARGIDEALNFLATPNHQIDTVVLDVMMPPGKAFTSLETHGGFIAGLALAKKIAREFPEIRIIGYSGNTEFDPTWFHKNATAFLRKPFLPKELVSVIKGESKKVAIKSIYKLSLKTLAKVAIIVGFIASVITIIVFFQR